MRIIKTSLFLLGILLFGCKSQHVADKTESNPELVFPKGRYKLPITILPVRYGFTL